MDKRAPARSLLLKHKAAIPILFTRMEKKYIGTDTSKLQMMKNANIAAKQSRETNT